VVCPWVTMTPTAQPMRVKPNATSQATIPTIYLLTVEDHNRVRPVMKVMVSLLGFALALGAQADQTASSCTCRTSRFLQHPTYLTVPALAACWALMTSKKSPAFTTRSRAGAETSVPFQFSGVVGVYLAVIS
jgi:hypothetical protein